MRVPSLLLVLAATAAAAGTARAEDPPKPPAPPAAKAPEPKKAPGEVVRGIDWQTDFDAARALAAKSGKGVLVYLTPEWFH
jgi:hypothetical protein